MALVHVVGSEALLGSSISRHVGGVLREIVAVAKRLLLDYHGYLVRTPSHIWCHVTGHSRMQLDRLPPSAC